MQTESKIHQLLNVVLQESLRRTLEIKFEEVLSQMTAEQITAMCTKGIKITIQVNADDYKTALKEVTTKAVNEIVRITDLPIPKEQLYDDVFNDVLSGVANPQNLGKR